AWRPKSPPGSDSEMLQEPASNGCSQPRKPAPKWAVPIPTHRPPHAHANSNSKSHNHCAEVLVGLAERGFQQASRITLTKSCRCDNSSGDGFAHRLPLAFARGVESFTHRRNRLRFERSGLHE